MPWITRTIDEGPNTQGSRASAVATATAADVAPVDPDRNRVSLVVRVKETSLHAVVIAIGDRAASPTNDPFVLGPGDVLDTATLPAEGQPRQLVTAYTDASYAVAGAESAPVRLQLVVTEITADRRPLGRAAR
ncbi:MAG: hypothetical protein AAGI91_17640 [Bacteroidota bacterium]